MDETSEVHGVEIEFWVDWYDGPVAGVATHRGAADWFEAEADWFEEAKLYAETRLLFLYPLSPEELARERGLHRLWEEQGRGRPVEEWPAVLRQRAHDLRLPTRYAERGRVAWFVESAPW